MFHYTGFICEVPQHGTHIGNISYSACLHRRPYVIVQYISFFTPNLCLLEFPGSLPDESIEGVLAVVSSRTVQNCYYHWYAPCLFTLKLIL